MDVLDRVFHALYAEFVEAGGLDQVDRIVSEDFERIARQATKHVPNPTRGVGPAHEP